MTFKRTPAALYRKIYKYWKQYIYQPLFFSFKSENRSKVNLCSGAIHLDGYWNIDLSVESDWLFDLNKSFPNFRSNSLDVLICMSAINYFDIQRGKEIIQQTYRILRPGGVARFSVQDFRLIAEKYLSHDRIFFDQVVNDQPRFPGRTDCEKVNNWFYGHKAMGNGCKFFYDYETLAMLFYDAGFSIVEQRKYLDSRLPDIQKIDNRPEQVFFLEAVK